MLAIVRGAPDNGFCRLERGELTLSQVSTCGCVGDCDTPISQFVPVFDQEVSAVAMEMGEGLTHGFSTLELFGRISVSYQPCYEMVKAAVTLRQKGGPASLPCNCILYINFWPFHIMPKIKCYSTILPTILY